MEGFDTNVEFENDEAEKIVKWSDLSSKDKGIICAVPTVCVICTCLLMMLFGGLIGVSSGILTKDSLTFNGYNGTGYYTLSSSLGYTEQLRNKAQEYLIKYSSSRNYKDYIKYSQKFDDVTHTAQSVNCAVTETSNDNFALKNGDTVTVACEYDKDLAKAAGIKYSKTTKTYTVKGLDDPVEVNLFDDLSVDWEYKNGYIVGKVTSTSDNEYFKNLDFIADCDNGVGILLCNTNKIDIYNQGYKPVDEGIKETKDGSKFFIEIDVNENAGVVESMTNNDELNQQIKDFIDFEVYNFIDKKGFVIKDRKINKEVGVFGFYLTSFENGTATYAVDTTDGEYYLKFSPQMVVMPDGTFITENSMTLANRLSGVVKYNDKMIS